MLRHPAGQAIPLFARRVLARIGVGAVALLSLASLGTAQWPDREEKSLYSILRSQDDIHEVKLADREIRDGEFASAIERLHGLLTRDRKGLIEIQPGLYRGMRKAVIDRLRELPQAGIEAYEKLVRLEAGSLIRRAFEGRDFESLRALADRFPTSRAGRRARARLGDLFLEAGRGHEATNEYTRLLQAMSSKDPARARVRERLAAARVLIGLGDPAANAEFVGLIDDTKTNFDWSSYGGGGDGSRQMSLPKRLGSNTVKVQLATPGYGSFFPLTVHAVGGVGGLYFNTGHQVVAIDPVAGRLQWKAPGPMVGAFDADDYYDTLSRETLLTVATSPDVVVAALQVPNKLERRSYRTLELLYKLPTRRLFAFDRHTGKRLWAHWDYTNGPRSKIYESHNAPAPPIIVGDTVFAATNDPTGAIAYYLSAYDLRTGDTRWRTLICSSQGEVNMFGNAKIEYAATPVALHEGVLYGTTNLGLCYAADAATGRVRWCAAYPIIPMPRTRLQGQAVRQVFFANNPVVVSHGVMMCTPLDSEHVLGFDIATGKLMWKVHWRVQAQKQNNLKWMLGVQRDELIMSGVGVIGIKIRPDGPTAQIRQIRSPQFFSGRSSQIARGTVTENHIVHPIPGGLSVFDSRGNTYRQPFQMAENGNVLMIDNMVVSAKANGVTIHVDREQLLDSAREAIREDPDNPAHYLRLAMLLRGDSADGGLGQRGADTMKLLRQGLAAGRKAGLVATSGLMQNLASELFQIALARADAEIVAGRHAEAAAMLAAARDETLSPQDWIKAQLKILNLQRLRSEGMIAELDRLAKTHPNELARFPVVGRIQARPYALWRSVAQVEDPADRIRRSQILLEEYPDVLLESQTGREFAEAAIRATLEKHGKAPYAAIEKRAAALLATAGKDVSQLRLVDQRFPHSEAAAEARRIVLDAAVLGGDLATAVAMTDRTKASLGAAALRRLMVAAEKAGNAPLARALGERLLREFGEVASDFAADGGATMRKLIRLRAAPEIPTTPPQLPVKDLAKIDYRGQSRGLEVLRSKIADGFTPPPRNLLYVRAKDQLLAYDLEQSFSDPVFSIPARLRLHSLSPDVPMEVCGTRLLINEGDQIRAVHSQTGEQIWTQSAGDRRGFELIAVQDGIVHAFSTLSDHGDGGTLAGFDALSGARLFLQPLEAGRETLIPRPFLGDLWTLHNPKGTDRVEVLRIDGVTGRSRQRIKIPSTVQKQLGLSPDRSGVVRMRRAHSGLLADEDGVYICASITRGSSAVAAFRHTGELRWSWQSPLERSLRKLAARHDRGLVLIDGKSGRTPGTQVIILDRKTGEVIRRQDLDGSARILSLQAEPHAPDLLFMEINEDSSSLLGLGIAENVSSFKYPTNQQRVFWRPPLVGEDFIAAALVDSSNVRMEMLVLDRASRRGKLPGGETLRKIPNRIGSTYQVLSHNGYILCQNRNAILVLGTERKNK